VTKLTVDGTDTTSLVVDQGASIAGDLGVTGTATFTAGTVHNGGLNGTTGVFSDSLTGTDVTLSGQLKGGNVLIGSPASAYTSEELVIAASAPTAAFYRNGAPVQAGNLLGELRWAQKSSTHWKTGASLQVLGDEAWSSNGGNGASSKMVFRLEDNVDISQHTEQLTIQADLVTAHVALTSQAALTADTSLSVGGTSTLAAVNASGAVALSAAGTALSVTNDASVGGALQVTGAITSAGAADLDPLTVSAASGTGLSVTADASIGGDLTVVGDLTVEGTTVTINTTTVEVEDKNIELGKVATPTDETADGGGITLKGASDKTIVYSNTNSSWDSSENVNVGAGKEYRINNIVKLDNTSVQLGEGAGDGQVYLGSAASDGSWRIDVSGGDLRFSKREAGVWITKQTIG
jgi:hypothetical protein